MAKIRPLFWLPDPIVIELADDWKLHLIADQPKRLRLDAKVFERLRWELYAFTGAQHIASFSVDRKAVLIELDSLDSCATRLHGALVGNRRTVIEKYRNKMSAKLTYPNFPKFGHQETEAAKGHRIALDYVKLHLEKSIGLESHSLSDLTSVTARPQVVTRLRTDIAAIKGLLNRSNEELGKHVASLEGRLINGKTFNYQPDPHREVGCRPEGVNLERFAGQLVQIYKWLGGKPSVHSDGPGTFDIRPPRPFMRFLDAMTDALPAFVRPPGKTLHSRAQTYRAKNS